MIPLFIPFAFISGYVVGLLHHRHHSDATTIWIPTAFGYHRDPFTTTITRRSFHVLYTVVHSIHSLFPDSPASYLPTFLFITFVWLRYISYHFCSVPFLFVYRFRPDCCSTPWYTNSPGIYVPIVSFDCSFTCYRTTTTYLPPVPTDSCIHWPRFVHRSDDHRHRVSGGICSFCSCPLAFCWNSALPFLGVHCSVVDSDVIHSMTWFCYSHLPHRYFDISLIYYSLTVFFHCSLPLGYVLFPLTFVCSSDSDTFRDTYTIPWSGDCRIFLLSILPFVLHLTFRYFYTFPTTYSTYDYCDYSAIVVLHSGLPIVLHHRYIYHHFLPTLLPTTCYLTTISSILIRFLTSSTTDATPCWSAIDATYRFPVLHSTDSLRYRLELPLFWLFPHLFDYVFVLPFCSTSIIWFPTVRAFLLRCHSRLFFRGCSDALRLWYTTFTTILLQEPLFITFYVIYESTISFLFWLLYSYIPLHSPPLRPPTFVLIRCWYILGILFIRPADYHFCIYPLPTFHRNTPPCITTSHTSPRPCSTIRYLPTGADYVTFLPPPAIHYTCSHDSDRYTDTISCRTVFSTSTYYGCLNSTCFTIRYLPLPTPYHVYSTTTSRRTFAGSCFAYHATDDVPFTISELLTDTTFYSFVPVPPDCSTACNFVHSTTHYSFDRYGDYYHRFHFVHLIGIIIAVPDVWCNAVRFRCCDSISAFSVCCRCYHHSRCHATVFRYFTFYLPENTIVRVDVIRRFYTVHLPFDFYGTYRTFTYAWLRWFERMYFYHLILRYNVRFHWYIPPLFFDSFQATIWVTFWFYIGDYSFVFHYNILFLPVVHVIFPTYTSTCSHYHFYIYHFDTGWLISVHSFTIRRCSTIFVVYSYCSYIHVPFLHWPH